MATETAGCLGKCSPELVRRPLDQQLCASGTGRRGRGTWARLSSSLLLFAQVGQAAPPYLPPHPLLFFLSLALLSHVTPPLLPTSHLHHLSAPVFVPRGPVVQPKLSVTQRKPNWLSSEACYHAEEEGRRKKSEDCYFLYCYYYRLWVVALFGGRLSSPTNSECATWFLISVFGMTLLLNLNCESVFTYLFFFCKIRLWIWNGAIFKKQPPSACTETQSPLPGWRRVRHSGSQQSHSRGFQSHGDVVTWALRSGQTWLQVQTLTRRLIICLWLLLTGAFTSCRSAFLALNISLLIAT